MGNNMMLIPTSSKSNALANIIVRDGAMEIGIGKILKSNFGKGVQIRLNEKRQYMSQGKLCEDQFIAVSSSVKNSIEQQALTLLGSNQKITVAINAWSQGDGAGLSWEKLGLEIITAKRQNKDMVFQEMVFHNHAHFSVKGSMGLEFEGFMLHRDYEGRFIVRYPARLWGEDNKEYPMVRWNCPAALGIFEQRVINIFRERMDSAPLFEPKEQDKNQQSGERRTTADKRPEKSPDNQEQAIGAIAD